MILRRKQIRGILMALCRADADDLSDEPCADSEGAGEALEVIRNLPRGTILVAVTPAEARTLVRVADRLKQHEGT